MMSLDDFDLTDLLSQHLSDEQETAIVEASRFMLLVYRAVINAGGGHREATGVTAAMMAAMLQVSRQGGDGG